MITATASLRPAEERDVRAMALIKLKNTSPLTLAMMGLDASSSYEFSEHEVEKQEMDVRQRLLLSHGFTTVATVLSAQGQETVAGWANWKIFDEPQPIEEEPSVFDGEDMDEATRLKLRCVHEFKTGLVRARNTHTGGKRNLRLCNLFTHPSYHREGIGSKLIQQGTDLTDQKGMVCALEASPMGKRLYERHGFQEVDRFTLDLAKYRVLKDGSSRSGELETDLYTTTIMLRQPKLAV